MLTAHADHIATPQQRAVEQFEREPGFCADRMLRPELFDRLDRPGRKAAAILDRLKLHCRGRIDIDQVFDQREAHKSAQGLHHVALRVRSQLADQPCHVIGLQFVQALVAVFDAEALQYLTTHCPRCRGELHEGGRAEIARDRFRNGSRDRALGTNNDGRRTVQRGCVRVHKRDRADRAGESDARHARPAEVEVALAALVHDVDVLQMQPRHAPSPSHSLRSCSCLLPFVMTVILPSLSTSDPRDIAAGITHSLHGRLHVSLAEGALAAGHQTALRRCSASCMARRSSARSMAPRTTVQTSRPMKLPNALTSDPPGMRAMVQVRAS